MNKNILSQEELAELLSPREDLHNEVRQPDVPDERSYDHRETVIQYLQDTVRQLLSEVSQLRQRLERLESAQAGNPAPVRKESFAYDGATLLKQQEQHSGSGLSRMERYRTKRSKRF